MGQSILDRRGYFDDDDAIGYTKRNDENKHWFWDWSNELQKKISQISEQIAYCKVYDLSATSHRDIVSRSWLAFTQFCVFPSTTQDDDAVYFGNVDTFEKFTLSLPSTLGVYAGDALTWEYYNGTTWTALTLDYDETDSTAFDGKRSFQTSGEIRFTAPTDWDNVEVDSQDAYWIRCRVSTIANLTTPAILTEVLSGEFVSSATYTDSGTTRTNELINGNETSCDVLGLGEFKLKITTSLGRILEKVFRFYSQYGVIPSDYQT